MHLRAWMVAGCMTASGAALADSIPLISLGGAEDFAVLGGSTVTNTGPTVINGSVGVSPGSAVTGFPPGVLQNGSIHSDDAVAKQAHTDATAAYNQLVGEAFTLDKDLTGQDLGGLTLLPGIYHFDSSAQLTGFLTLNFQGDPNASFHFQIGSTLTTASNSLVTLLNGASVQNVFWQIGSSATLGTGTDFVGNIIANTSITMTTGATLEGRALALNGAVTLDSNEIDFGADEVILATIPEPGTGMMGVLLVGLLGTRLRSRGKSPIRAQQG